MKKSTMETLRNYLNANNIPELAAVKDEINAEFEKNAAKAEANRELYAEAREVVMRVLSDVPLTVAEIWEKVEDQMPEGFTKGKVQYALRETWAADVVKVEAAKGPNSYRRA